MTKILLTGLSPKMIELLTTKLTELGNDVEYYPEDEILENYEDVLPDMLLMNYNDDSFYNNAQKIIEFDNTACIFALTGFLEKKEEEHMYQSGVRVILDRPEMETIDKFIDELFNSCNDLEHENCVGCWKLGRFENLKQL